MKWSTSVTLHFRTEQARRQEESKRA